MGKKKLKAPPQKQPATMGEVICCLRLELKMTQQDLAAKAGIDTGTLGRIERDEVCPGLTTITRLAKALNVTADRLIYFRKAEMADDLQPDREQMRQKLRQSVQEIVNTGQQVLKLIDFI